MLNVDGAEKDAIIILCSAILVHNKLRQFPPFSSANPCLCSPISSLTEQVEGTAAAAAAARGRRQRPTATTTTTTWLQRFLLRTKGTTTTTTTTDFSVAAVQRTHHDAFSSSISGNDPCCSCGNARLHRSGAPEEEQAEGHPPLPHWHSGEPRLCRGRHPPERQQQRR
jgi:hypothetical protein